MSADFSLSVVLERPGKLAVTRNDCHAQIICKSKAVSSVEKAAVAFKASACYSVGRQISADSGQQDMQGTGLTDRSWSGREAGTAAEVKPIISDLRM